MHPHLQNLLADAEAVTAEAERLRASLSDDQLTWRPEPGVWSVADCFEHLRKIGKAYYPRIEAALQQARPANGQPFRPGFVARHFIRLSGPDPRLKMPAPKAIRPKTSAPARPEAIGRFIEQQDGLLRLLREADGRDLNTGRFASPLGPLLKFTVGEGLTLMVRHEQRHLQQAQRVTTHPGFPQEVAAP